MLRWGFKRGLVGASVYGINDYFVHKNPKRTARSAAFGFLFFGPICQAYYPAAERLCGCPVRKMILDQTAWSALWNTGYFACHDTELTRCLRDGARATRRGWAVWPMVHAVTYTCIPLHNRAAWVLACDALWINYVSKMGKK